MNPPDEPLIDASVHLFFKSDRDLRDYLSEPFRSRGYSEPDVAWFAPPGPRYAEGTAGPSRRDHTPAPTRS